MKIYTNFMRIKKENEKRISFYLSIYVAVSLLTTIVIKVPWSIVMLITTDASSVAATWATSRTRITTATWWIASRTMSAAVATRAASRTWVCKHQIYNVKFTLFLSYWNASKILHERLCERDRLRERDRYDGGSGGFSDTSACSARRKLPMKLP